MAIDTLAKRNSVLSVNSYILPIPDLTIDQGDRQTLLRTIGSILASGTIAAIKNTINKISINIGLSI